MKTEFIVLNKAHNATLTAYLLGTGGEFAHVPKRPAVLVLPGGGYSMCSDREADPVALAYAQAGYHTFVLRYAVGKNAQWPNPLDDYEQAMELIRSKEEEWHLYPDKIAVIGFSAGGHLAASAATIARNKPNAAILGYPVTEGATARECLPSAPDLVSRVDADTCPCFLFATRTDSLVPITNTINFTAALERFGISFECHIYAYGPHGFSVAHSDLLDARSAPLCSRAKNWVADSVEWLKDVLGDFGEGKMTKPACGRRAFEDALGEFSVDCTMSRLMSDSRCKAILEPILAAAAKGTREKYADRTVPGTVSDNPGLGIASKMTLRSVLGYGNVPEEQIAQLDAQLRAVTREK